MTIQLLHTFLTLLLPFLIGLALGWLVRPYVRVWYLHAACCLAAVGVSLACGYAGFLILSGLMTQQWPQAVTLAGLAYALAWFALVAIFTSAPLTVAGYACAASCRSVPAPRG